MSRNQRRNRRNKSGSTQTTQSARSGQRATVEEQSVDTVVHRSSTETKSSLKTTELIAYAGAVLAVIMTALALDEDRQGGGDPFGAESAIRYITYLTIGYMVARGLAKSGSYEYRTDDSTDVVDDEVVPARAVVDHDTQDDDTHDDDDDDADDRDSDLEVVDTALEPSDEVTRAASGNAQTRP